MTMIEVDVKDTEITQIESIGLFVDGKEIDRIQITFQHRRGGKTTKQVLVEWSMRTTMEEFCILFNGARIMSPDLA